MVRFAIIFVLSLSLTISLNITDFRVANAAEPSVFSQVLPGYVYRFPEDFYSHDDFRIEWWYYTGNLEEVARLVHLVISLHSFVWLLTE